MKRNFGIDLFRVVLIFTVVLIHSPGKGVEYRDGILWWLPYANACFALLAGWFMFQDEKLTLRGSLGEWLCRRSKRLLVPYLIFEFINTMLHFAAQAYGGVSNWPTIGEWVGYIFMGDGSVPLWFVACLFYTQIMLLLARRLIGRYEIIFIVLCMTLAILGQMYEDSACEYVRKMSLMLRWVSWGVVLKYLSGFWGGRNQKFLNGLGLVALAIIIGSKTRSVCVPVEASVFSWCYLFGMSGGAIKVLSDKMKVLRVVTALAEASMGIYCVHWLIIRIIVKRFVSVETLVLSNGYLIVLLNACLAFMFSFVLYRVSRRVKWLWGSV